MSDTQIRFQVKKTAFQSAAAHLPETGIGGEAWSRRQGLINAFAKDFPEAKWTIRGGYVVPGDNAETRVRDWFTAQGAEFVNG